MAKRISELDGLRGTAALLVVVAHYFGETPHGWVGLMWGWQAVDVFFVLSGYLIGSIILDSSGEAGFAPSFYLRRAARIVPAYGMTIAAGFAIAWLFRSKPWCDHLLPLAAYLTFTQNFAIAAGLDGGLWLLPTWTLAVEEQFYLLMPVLIMLVPRHWLGGMLIALFLAAGLFRWAYYDIDKFAALTLLPGRMDMLFAGVIAALVQRRLDLKRHLFALRLTPLIAMVILLAVVVIDRTRVFQLIAPSALGVGAASFILAMVHGAPEGARFRSSVLQAAGRISYGLYLFHQPVSGLVHGLLFNAVPDVNGLPQILASFLAFAIALGLAQISWLLVEAPIIDWVKRRRDNARASVELATPAPEVT